MLNTLKTNVLLPLMGRAGTATALWLTSTYGVHADLAHQVGIGVTACGLVIADLLIGYLNRKQAIKRASV